MILRRPRRNATAAEIRTYLAQVAAALDEAGIGPEDRFEVVRVPEGDMDRVKFVSDSETSRKAAFANVPNRETQRGRILTAIGRCGAMGLTADEAGARLALPAQTISARMGELRAGDWIEAARDGDGRTRKRKTRYGREAEVMIWTPKARAQALDGDG